MAMAGAMAHSRLLPPNKLNNKKMPPCYGGHLYIIRSKGLEAYLASYSLLVKQFNLFRGGKKSWPSIL